MVVEDAVSHKVVGIVLAYRISDFGAARMLDQAARNHVYPQAIRAPCEHVFVSEHFQSWSRTRGIQLVWENAGRTSLKGCIESANRKFWSECLGALSAETLRQARALAACWERGFNGADSPGSVLQ